jgi:hypothetical protein
LGVGPRSGKKFVASKWMKRRRMAREGVGEEEAGDCKSGKLVHKVREGGVLGRAIAIQA